jgi:soluble cytochrome b562
MMAGDPIRAAQEVKRTAALLRDARAVLRKLDVLAAAARAADDPAHADISALRDGCERLVSQLGHREQTLQRRARDAVRRLR